MDNKFELASRMAVRFQTVKGMLTVEDLWQLPLTSKNSASLDGIAQALHKELKDTDTVSFVTTKVNTNDVTQLKFDIVKHVIDTRLNENNAEVARRENAEKRQRVLQIIQSKKEAALESMSIEELEKML